MNMHIRKLSKQRSMAFAGGYQPLFGFALAVVAPVLALGVSDGGSLSASTQNSLVACALAYILGGALYQRMASYPGVTAARYILPAFLSTYGLAVSALFLARLEYSRAMVLGSVALCVLWFFMMSLFTQRRQVLRLLIVPGGRVDRLLGIAGIDWQFLGGREAPPVRASGIVADLDADVPDQWKRYLAESALAGISVYHIKQVLEALTGKVEIDKLSENALGALNPNAQYMMIRQALDWIVALAVLILLAPFLVALMIAIRLDSPGPAIFRQTRIGYRGRPFTMYKLRTMKVAEPKAQEEREHAMTKRGDDRITRVGHFMRVTRLDELPQIVNILKGEMGWIGPRPEAAPLSAWYEAEIPFYSYRHIVRPGITGWAQVNQGHVAAVEDVSHKLHYDFYYIKNFSPWLDIVIALKTLKTIKTGFGAC